MTCTRAKDSCRPVTSKSTTGLVQAVRSDIVQAAVYNLLSRANMQGKSCCAASIESGLTWWVLFIVCPAGLVSEVTSSRPTYAAGWLRQFGALYSRELASITRNPADVIGR